jgi:hypothetical protein
VVRVFLILSLVATLKGELITLTVVPNNLSTSTYSTDNGSAVVEITNSGTVEADITLDPFTRNPTNVTFIGGTLFYSDANSVYTPNTPPQTDNLILNFANVSGSLGTINPNSPVDPITGALVNDDHTTGLTSGNLYAEYQIEFLGSLVPIFSQTTDFSTTPQISPFFGTNTLTSELTANGPLFDTVQITLTSVADTAPRDLNDIGLDLIISGEGGFSAIGTLQLPSSAFQSWIDNHQAINQPPLLIYSLGLPPSQNQLPLIFTTNEATLTLPDSGTLAEVTLQHSSDLQTWSNLQTFPAGITGIQIIPLPQSKVAYVRLALP